MFTILVLRLYAPIPNTPGALQPRRGEVTRSYGVDSQLRGTGYTSARTQVDYRSSPEASSHTSRLVPEV